MHWNGDKSLIYFPDIALIFRLGCVLPADLIDSMIAVY